MSYKNHVRRRAQLPQFKENETSDVTLSAGDVTVTPFGATSSTHVPATTTALNCGYNCSRYVYYQPVTRHTYEMLTNKDREKIKVEYYKNYDFMTGLRTAASLGGAILLFSLFVLYKMKCRSGRRRKSLATLENGVTLVGDLGGDSPDKQQLVHFTNGNKAGSQANNGGGDGRNSVVFSSPPEGALQPMVHRSACGGGSSGSDAAAAAGSCRGSDAAPCSSGMKGGLARHQLLSSGAPPTSGVQAVLPRFRLNSEPDGAMAGRRDSTARPVACSFLNEPSSIDIHIIQPTPNVSPCGSIRRLSEDVSTFTDTCGHAADPATSTVFIPLLSIPKPARHAKGGGSSRTKASKAATSGLPVTEASLPPSCSSSAQASTYGCSVTDSVVQQPLLSDVAATDCEPSERSEMIDAIKYIDCSDSDACSACSSSDSNEAIGGGGTCCAGAVDSPPAAAAPLLHHRHLAQQSSSGSAMTSSGDANAITDAVSETRC